MTRLPMWVFFLGAGMFPGVAAAQSGTEGDARVLDLAHPELWQRIDVADPAGFKFVHLSIVQVTNPTRVGLIFEVAFRPDGGSRVRLGGFSLYPPDNPGSFIVSTRHLIHSPGLVVVSLHTATPVEPGTPLSVKMGIIALAQGP